MNAFANACRYFTDCRNETKDVRYLVHYPRRQMSYIGQGLSRIIRYQRDGFHIETSAGAQHLPPIANPLSEIGNLMDPQRPGFMMISPDLQRPACDPDLPLVVLIQPQIEVEFRGFDAETDDRNAAPDVPTLQWETQSDDIFLQRLSGAIATLQGYPQGKMIITRPYQRVTGAQDPFRLFEIFSATEPAAACSHFLQIGADTYSLGCSPENVFELTHGRLAFDVVAATRGVSPDPAVDARWLEALKNDPKERREHLMALARYKARIETLTEPASLVQEKYLEILQLGQVRHLYSRLSGIARQGLDWSRLLADSFPALSSYPDELKPLADDGEQPLRFYGGVLGHVSAGGHNASFYLNLRAAMIKGQVLYTQGGVGVIAESVPEKELREVNNKLSGLMKAVGIWEQAPPATGGGLPS